MFITRGGKKFDRFLVQDGEIAAVGKIRSVKSRTYSLLIRRIKTVRKIYNFVAICNWWSQQDSNLRPLAYDSKFYRDYSLSPSTNAEHFKRQSSTCLVVIGGYRLQNQHKPRTQMAHLTPVFGRQFIAVSSHNTTSCRPDC